MVLILDRKTILNKSKIQMEDFTKDLNDSVSKNEDLIKG
jgi:hypothetical protein